MVEVTKQYLQKCDKKGLPIVKNISKVEREGIKEMKEAKEEVYLCTDKSGGLAANKKEFYVEAMQPHVSMDPVITWEEQCGLERRMTGHTLQFARLLRLGEKWDNNGTHWARVKNALRTKFCLAPPVSGYPKDHKLPTAGREHLGPQMRPVCGAGESSNGPYSHMLSEVLTILGDVMDQDIGSLCLSDEEMLCAVEMYNERCAEATNSTTFSLDVGAMFPSFVHKEVARTCRIEFLHSRLTVKVDVVALGLYLAIIYQDRRQELEDLGLNRVVQKRIHPRARKIMISTEEVLEPGSNTVSKFHPPEQVATKEQEKLMFALALEEGILAVFSSHYYSFNGDVKLQQEGGPIGLKVSGSVGKVVMLAWSRELKKKVDIAAANIPSFHLHLHKLYVDDNNIACEELPPGTRLVGEGWEVQEDKVEEDRMISGDKRTALLVQELANTICPYLQVVADFPSNHTSGWMPVLNIQFQVADDNSIDYKWFKKPVATPYYTILNRSAISATIKRFTHLQRGLTMLRNTRQKLHPELRRGLLEHLAEEMWMSGYPEDNRRGVIESVVKGYEKQVVASEAGEVPLFRPREWQSDARKRKKLLQKVAWYRPSDTVLRVPYTPNSELATRVREVVQEEGARLDMKVKVQEEAGVSLKRSVVRSDLGAGELCPQGDCPLCLSGDGRGGGLHHHRSGAVYKGECKLCGDLVSRYWGESGDSGYCRTLQHLKAIENKEENNAFAKHLEIHHPDQEGNKGAFKFSLLGVFCQPLVRGVTESVCIHTNDADISMNSKAEWLQPMVARVVVTRDLEELEEVGGRDRQGRGGGARGRGRGGGGGRQARRGQRRMRGGA